MYKCILIIIVILLLPYSLHAATIMVNDTSDANGSSPKGTCTLREAIIAANTDTPVDGCESGSGDDTIILPAGTYILSITGGDEDASQSGDLDVTSNFKLVGAGAENTIIDGGAIDRVLHVDPACTGIIVDISGITISNGMTPESTDNIKLSGGGILNCGNLAISDAKISDNKSFNIGSIRYVGYGAGIYNQAKGTLTGKSLLIFNNSQAQGAGVANEGVVILINSNVYGNITAGGPARGGGIINTNNGKATLINVTINNNRANSSGGGIANNSGALELVNSTINDNNSAGGGGILNEDDGSVHITNSTISGNSAWGGGGGITNHGLMSLTSVTIANNTSNSGLTAGLFNYNPGVLTIENSLLYNNKVAGVLYNCSLRVGGHSNYGYNLENGNSCSFTAIGDKVNVDPLLLSLQDNGGSTYTHALTVGSPAIDAGNPAGCKAEGGTRDLLNDQRSFLRPVDGDGNGSAICDIGAYEYGATPSAGSDLSIQAWGSPNPVAVDGNLTYNIVATNNGPQMADGVVITINLSPNVTLISTSTNKGICYGTRTVKCIAGSLFKADSIMPTIVAKVNGAGLLSSIFSVESGVSDPNLTNNIISVITSTSGLLPARRMDGITQVGSYFNLQEAFDAAQSDDAIEAMTTIFSENITIDTGVPIIFKGGFNSDFSSRTGYTTILGGLKVKSGMLGVQYLKVQ